MLKKVRIHNNTTDQTFVRVYITHFQANTGLTADVAPGQFVQNNHMTQGHRGVVVYEDFNENVIATGEFVLQDQNIKVFISGSSGTGYSVSYAVWHDD